MGAGGCFCGAVRYETSGPLKPVTYCHCSKCRKWHGHAGAYTALPREALKLIAQRGLEWHSVSPTVRRGFCRVCGSCLFFDDSGDKLLGLVVGTLDQPTGLKSKGHIFVASKADYYELADDGLKRFDEGS